MYYWLLSTTGNPEEPKSEEFADFLNRVIGSNDPVFSRWAITTVWPQMAELRPSINTNSLITNGRFVVILG